MSRPPSIWSQHSDTAHDPMGGSLRDVVVGVVAALDVIAIVAIVMLVIAPRQAPNPTALALIVAASWAMATILSLLTRSHVRRRREAGLPTGRLAVWWDDVAGAWALRLLPLLGAVVLVVLAASHGLLPPAAYLAAILAALIAFLSIDRRDPPSRSATRRRGATTIAVTWFLAAAAVATATGTGLAILATAGAVTALVISKIRRAATCSEPDQQPR